MKFFTHLTALGLTLLMCLVSLATAGGDKSAKTTVSSQEARVKANNHQVE